MSTIEWIATGSGLIIIAILAIGFIRREPQESDRDCVESLRRMNMNESAIKNMCRTNGIDYEEPK